MRTATELLTQYAAYHRDRRNIISHFVGVPLIVFAVGVLLARPVLAIQGYDDEYGTMAQLDEIASRVRAPSELLRLENCGHSPFRDQPDRTLSAIQSFVRKLIVER